MWPHPALRLSHWTYEIRTAEVRLLRSVLVLLQSPALAPLGGEVFCMFRARSRSVFGVGVHSLSDRSCPDDSHREIVVSDFRGFPGGVEDLELSMLGAFVCLRRSLAPVGRRIDSMEVA